MKKRYEIWCDGSYRQTHHALGAAWLCVAPDGTRTHNSITPPVLRDTHAHGSDIAEIIAFTEALKPLPSASRVTVHMDCRNVIDWLSNGKLNNKNKKAEPRIAGLFDAAIAEKTRMAEIDIVFTSDKNSHNMGYVHTLSRVASTPEKVKRNADKNTRYAPRP